MKNGQAPGPAPGTARHHVWYPRRGSNPYPVARSGFCVRRVCHSATRVCTRLPSPHLSGRSRIADYSRKHVCWPFSPAAHRCQVPVPPVSERTFAAKPPECSKITPGRRRCRYPEGILLQGAGFAAESGPDPGAGGQSSFQSSFNTSTDSGPRALHAPWSVFHARLQTAHRNRVRHRARCVHRSCSKRVHP